MGKCFIGFPGFDCREDLWRGVFHTNAYGGSIRFRKLLSLQDDIPDRPLLSRKLSGSVAWAQDADAFLLYSDKPSLYQQRWLSQWTCPPGCVAMFRRFIASVPTIASNTEEARFLPPARQLCTYLEKILLQLSSHSADADACIAAGKIGRAHV